MSKMLWDKESCHIEALKYKTKKDFKLYSNSAYRAACKYKWLKDIASHLSNAYIEWTKEKLLEEAKKYTKRVDFQKESPAAYGAAYRSGILEDLYVHMEICKNKWNKETLKKEALKYKTKKEFKKNNNPAYAAALRLRILNNICDHMIVERENWNLEKIKEISLKCTTLSDFRENHKKAYTASIAQGWFKNISKDLKRAKRKHNIEECFETALKYKTRSDFKKNNAGMYRFANNKGILDQIFKHMKKIGNAYYRCIYAYEWNQEFVYIGLTYNFKKRHCSHKQSERYKKYTRAYGKPRISRTDYIYNINECGTIETHTIEKYKKDNWKILNIAKAGSVGGSRVLWNRDKCRELASKYTKMVDFRKNHPGAYIAVYKNKWKDLTAHLTKHINIPTSFIVEKSSVYKTKMDLIKNGKNLYQIARKRGLLKEIYENIENNAIK